MVVSVILAGCNKKSENSDTASRESIYDDIELKDVNGMPIDLNQYEGKVIFINFWATWCKPCLAEMPSIEKAQSILEEKNIIFLLASNEELTRIQNFKNKSSLKFNYVQVQNMEALNIQALPTTFIIDPKGELIFSEAGYRNWEDPKNIELITKIMNNYE
ncbi:MAG TPA: TlpA disulfide reductase family protein [Cyclobacteriaceae bacterium]|nr:TlpA disulfide reductase family protein [Cyclobacteriaceae bacterium]HRJ80926.1 TlpA disulfide reductase family protein [Cyclobacteriaceae bacterium]